MAPVSRQLISERIRRAATRSRRASNDAGRGLDMYGAYALLMDQRTLEAFLYFGMALRYVNDVDEGDTLAGDGLLIANIEQLLRHFEELDLPVSLRLAETDTVESLATVLADLRTASEEAESEGEDPATLSSEDTRRLKGVMSRLVATVRAEALGIKVYVPTPKRFDTAKLVEEIESLFAPGVYESLTEAVRADISEAGKCIAFDRPTAAAFHTMRAVEGQFEEFYRQWVVRGRLGLESAWKRKIDQMNSRRTKPPESLLVQLDSIRAHFRNPTQHPDAWYDVYEAQELFSGALDVIARMARTHPPRKT